MSNKTSKASSGSALANLTPEQAKFARWISEKVPYLEHLFDWTKGAFKPDAVELYLSTASHGEAIMAKFALGIWMGENRLGFELMEAAGVLDSRSLAVIAGWLSEPFWP